MPLILLSQKFYMVAQPGTKYFANEGDRVFMRVDNRSRLRRGAIAAMWGHFLTLPSDLLLALLVL